MATLHRIGIRIKSRMRFQIRIRFQATKRPSVQSLCIQESRVQASRVQAYKRTKNGCAEFSRSESKSPGSMRSGAQNPSVHIVHPESSFFSMH